MARAVGANVGVTPRSVKQRIVPIEDGIPCRRPPGVTCTSERASHRRCARIVSGKRCRRNAAHVRQRLALRRGVLASPCDWRARAYVACAAERQASRRRPSHLPRRGVHGHPTAGRNLTAFCCSARRPHATKACGRRRPPQGAHGNTRSRLPHPRRPPDRKSVV